MPRNIRIDVGGEIYHVINRANSRLQIFHNDKDYKLFEEVLKEAKERALGKSVAKREWESFTEKIIKFLARTYSKQLFRLG